MDAQQLRQLQPKLRRFLQRFADCFARKDTRVHLPTYIEGQLSDLPDKSAEPLALKAGGAPRTLQEFLSQLQWDHDRMRDRVLAIVRTEHAGAHPLGIRDETSFAKKGDKTPGVQRQWWGAVGKKENGMVPVHLGYASDDFHCLLASELFLPARWSQDRPRCREAGIPDTLVYRPQWQIGWELYDRAVGQGLRFDWLTFDENDGGKPDFLKGLSARQQRFVAEVPRSFLGWRKAPRVVTRPFHRRRGGRRRKVPRLAAGSPAARRGEELLQQQGFRAQPWQRWRVKDGEKGPMVGAVKHARLHPKDDNGLPGAPLHLLVARAVLHPEEIKFFVSNAPAETPVTTLLLVAFARWRVERWFEDQKGEGGLDHYEGRRYVGLKRHLVLRAVSYLFLARTRQEFGGENPGTDGVPGADGAGSADPVLGAGAASADEVAGADGGRDPEGAAEECHGPQEPVQTNAPTIA
jgi:SRSO17 transposase